MRVLQCREMNKEEWEDWEYSELDLDEWDLNAIETIQYRVIEREETEFVCGNLYKYIGPGDDMIVLCLSPKGQNNNRFTGCRVEGSNVFILTFDNRWLKEMFRFYGHGYGSEKVLIIK